MTFSDLARSAALCLLLTACVPGPPGAPPAVPAIRAERIPAPPESSVTLIWQPGHWEWDDQDYRWAAGEWIPRSGHGPLWQDGFWRRRGATYEWVPAHWM